MELRKRTSKGAVEGSDESTKTPTKSTASPAAQPATPPAAAPKSKFSTFVTRTIVGLIMIFAFFGILSAGHAFVCCFVVLLQVFTFREMINIRFREAKEKKLWGFRSLHWYENLP
jgi:predicted lipid-binding transport protein (Tim44 family)